MTTAELPYAAELIDVTANEERWRPAAEKMLRGYGLRLLVSQRHQNAVLAFIDENDMRGVVEYSIVPDAPAREHDADAGTLAAKLTVDTEHPYGHWLQSQLARRFDHVCVESVDELDDHRTAVTLHGTVKSPDNRYRKDDREALTRRSRAFRYASSQTSSRMRARLRSERSPAKWASRAACA